MAREQLAFANGWRRHQHDMMKVARSVKSAKLTGGEWLQMTGRRCISVRGRMQPSGFEEGAAEGGDVGDFYYLDAGAFLGMEF